MACFVHAVHNNNNNNNNNNTSYFAHLSITMISALRIKDIDKIKTAPALGRMPNVSIQSHSNKIGHSNKIYS